MAQHNRQCKTCGKDFVTEKENYFQCYDCFKKANDKNIANKKSGSATGGGSGRYEAPKSSGGGYGPSTPSTKPKTTGNSPNAKPRYGQIQPNVPASNTKYRAEPARPPQDKPIEVTPVVPATPSSGRVAKVHVTFELDEAWLTEHVLLPIVKASGGQIDLDIKGNNEELKRLQADVEQLKKNLDQARYMQAPLFIGDPPKTIAPSDDNSNVCKYPTPEETPTIEEPVVEEIVEVEVEEPVAEATIEEPADEVNIDTIIEGEFPDDGPPF